MPVRLKAAQPDFAKALDALIAGREAATRDVDATVASILERVRREGDGAVIAFARRFDGLDPGLSLRVPDQEIAAAAGRCDPAVVAALGTAKERIWDYHHRQLPRDCDYRDSAGLRLGWRWRPIRSVGPYVPGGTAAYPSSVLMSAVPARVAGVERLVMAVPAPEGKLNPLVLAAAALAGVDEVYRVGGAQAVAAFAYGTDTIPRVDKIVGPGNAYVASAKRQLFGRVGIDLVAGPSEILVVADRLNDPDWIAADLMSQAEHDEAAQAILITDDADFADLVEAAVERALSRLPRASIARGSWERHGAVIELRALEEAPAIVDCIAPEHVALAVAEPQTLLERIRNAGAIFLGRFAPEAVGDYLAGPSHVLPTGGGARFASGLGVLDFLKRSSVIGLDAAALTAIGPAAERLARAEGLDAHALSIRLRLGAGDS